MNYTDNNKVMKRDKQYCVHKLLPNVIDSYSLVDKVPVRRSLGRFYTLSNLPLLCPLTSMMCIENLRFMKLNVTENKIKTRMIRFREVAGFIATVKEVLYDYSCAVYISVAELSY